MVWLHNFILLVSIMLVLFCWHCLMYSVLLTLMIGATIIILSLFMFYWLWVLLVLICLGAVASPNICKVLLSLFFLLLMPFWGKFFCYHVLSSFVTVFWYHCLNKLWSSSFITCFSVITPPPPPFGQVLVSLCSVVIIGYLLDFGQDLWSRSFVTMFWCDCVPKLCHYVLVPLCS